VNAPAGAAPTKGAIRDAIRARRRTLDPAWAAAAGAAAQARVTALPEFAAARTVLCYLAMAGEAGTAAILEAAWKAGKRVYVPAYDAGGRTYAPAELGPAAQVRAGHWNVPEPAEPRWMAAAGADLAVVPGLAFDRDGGRIGHGAGHYDRLLARWAGPRCFKVGFGFEFQIVAAAPLEAHDVRMDAVATEQALYRAGRQHN
jgi:5-formyltetrahydrofolate cyclo-ligase